MHLPFYSIMRVNRSSITTRLDEILPQRCRNGSHLSMVWESPCQRIYRRPIVVLRQSLIGRHTSIASYVYHFIKTGVQLAKVSFHESGFPIGMCKLSPPEFTGPVVANLVSLASPPLKAHIHKVSYRSNRPTDSFIGFPHVALSEI